MLNQPIFIFLAFNTFNSLWSYRPSLYRTKSSLRLNLLLSFVMRQAFRQVLQFCYLLNCCLYSEINEYLLLLNFKQQMHVFCRILFVESSDYIASVCIVSEFVLSEYNVCTWHWMFSCFTICPGKKCLSYTWRNSIK